MFSKTTNLIKLDGRNRISLNYLLKKNAVLYDWYVVEEKDSTITLRPLYKEITPSPSLAKEALDILKINNQITKKAIEDAQNGIGLINGKEAEKITKKYGI